MNVSHCERWWFFFTFSFFFTARAIEFFSLPFKQLGSLSWFKSHFFFLIFKVFCWRFTSAWRKILNKDWHRKKISFGSFSKFFLNPETWRRVNENSFTPSFLKITQCTTFEVCVFKNFFFFSFQKILQIITLIDFPRQFENFTSSLGGGQGRENFIAVFT